MVDRKRYILEKDSGSISVYHTSYINIYGRVGVINANGTVRIENPPYIIPDYIVNESVRILKASEFELGRGYTLSGKSVQLGTLAGKWGYT